jgi:endonuclease/exonuclease/phosphatase (EEP) superfamily protein YafD
MKGSRFGWVRTWFDRALLFCAVAYPLTLLISWALLRFVGEKWWLTSVGLYLPLAALALPLPFLCLALWLRRRRRLLALQLVALYLLLFPLLGLTINWPGAAVEPSKGFRLVSYNVNSGHFGFDAVAAEITRNEPDVAFVQEIPFWVASKLTERLKVTLPHVREDTEFLVASKFPIVSAEYPPNLAFFGRERHPRFVRVVLATPLGNTVFYHVHTVSPRGAFHALRGDGLTREIRSGRLFTGARAESLHAHAALRELQIETMAKRASAEPGPVVIVGDTNLPILSPARHRHLGRFQDGFSEAGLGFGNTFPSKFPWMRIDVALASDHVRFTRFEVGQGLASDHRCIVADLSKAD